MLVTSQEFEYGVSISEWSADSYSGCQWWFQRQHKQVCWYDWEGERISKHAVMKKNCAFMFCVCL